MVQKGSIELPILSKAKKDGFESVLRKCGSEWQFVEALFDVGSHRSFRGWFFKHGYLRIIDVNDLGIQVLDTEGEAWCRKNLFRILHERMKATDTEMEIGRDAKVFERAFLYLEEKYLPEFLSAPNRDIREACSHALVTKKLIQRDEEENALCQLAEDGAIPERN